MHFTQFLLILSCLCTVVLSDKTEDLKINPHEISQVTSTLLAQTITHGFINRIQKYGASQLSSNPRFPLLPNIPDPICIDANEILLNIPGILIGRLALVNDGELFGLSGFKDDLAIMINGTNENQLNVGWDMQLPAGGFTGDYEYEFTEFLGAPSNILGAGSLFASLQGVFFRFDAKGKIFGLNETMSLDYLDVDMGCENVTVHPDFGQDPPVDIGTLIKDFFEAWIWNELTRPFITELVRCMIHTVVKDCSVEDLLSNNTACLDFNILPCLLNIIPTTISPINDQLPLPTLPLLQEILLGIGPFNYHPYACPRSEPTGGSSSTAEVTTGTPSPNGAISVSIPLLPIALLSYFIQML